MNLKIKINKKLKIKIKFFNGNFGLVSRRLSLERHYIFTYFFLIKN